MVAPTRTPQSRGVKCDLCKKILKLATWLDQTKLAKNIESAEAVLDLLGQHEKSECPCIPKNIENLLVGSTHFEIHRLVANRLDIQVHKKQSEISIETRRNRLEDISTNKSKNINDCNDNLRSTRFRTFTSNTDKKHNELTKLLVRHLALAIDSWKLAMDDQASPFNSALALRLGLTHHVIYACYLFKYYKILDYQLTTAHLLLNLFETIQGVTENAVLHAHYLLVRALMDCDQLQSARQCLKQAIKSPNYLDKSHYESILLHSVSCEISLLESGGDYDILQDLAKLAAIQPDDKLQHYYARTFAVNVLIRYIHCYQGKSELCFEFYHLFRYICAIIRRCYESSFELVLFERDVKSHTEQAEPQNKQILDHSWIRFAVCDHVFSTFELLSHFYMRSGQPESLELLYNGLILIAHRNGSCYWQAKMCIIGAQLDLICDKEQFAKVKLDIASYIIGHTNDPYLMNLLRLDLEVSSLALLYQQANVINIEVVQDLLQRIKACRSSLQSRISQIELLDFKSQTVLKMVRNMDINESFIVLGQSLGYLSLRVLKIGILSLLSVGNVNQARKIISHLETQFNSMNYKILEYYECQILLEIFLQYTEVYRSENILLEAINLSNVFLETESPLVTIESQLSLLNIDDESTATNTISRKKPSKTKPKISKLALGRRSRRKGSYNVASRSEENLYDGKVLRSMDTIEFVKNFSSLSNEEIVLLYLKNSEPNPDYLLYRQAHELMFSFLLKKGRHNRDQLLYHFTESCTSNTMRYRWMMFEEQQASLYDPPTSTRCNNHLKQLGFCGAMVNFEKNLKSMLKSIAANSKITQLKYIADIKSQMEHILVATLDNENDPIYVHLKKSISSDDFLEDAKKENCCQFTIPNQLAMKIEEAKKTLFLTNNQARSEKRQRLESEVGLILHNLENDLFGPFRFIFCGKICDKSYEKFVEDTAQDIKSIMIDLACNSDVVLKSVIENAPLLNREEFCQSLSFLFGCSSISDETRKSFNKWQKSMETFVDNQMPGSSKTNFLQTLPRGSIGLILDKDLENIPFESLPIVRITKQGIFRVPSLRLFNIISSRYCGPVKVDANETAYILDPANNLSKTRERFESKLRSQNRWVGTIAQPPKVDHLTQWISRKQIYIFIGHGAGTAYYNKLCKGRGLSAMSTVRTLSIVMGCSSGRVLAEGPRLESFGISWVFIFRGSPSYIGLLWDVTDTDIDRFLDSFLDNWMGSKWNKSAREGFSVLSADALVQARPVCQFKFLVGSTPVIYGLPAICETCSNLSSSN